MLALFPGRPPRTRLGRAVLLGLAYLVADLADWTGVRAETAIIELEALR